MTPAREFSSQFCGSSVSLAPDTCNPSRKTPLSCRLPPGRAARRRFSMAANASNTFCICGALYGKMSGGIHVVHDRGIVGFEYQQRSVFGFRTVHRE